MSINLHVGPGVALYDGEIITNDKSDVVATFKKFSHSCEHMKGTKHGHVYLTNFRLIFKNGKNNDKLCELSMPFTHIKEFEIKQPVFGANYLQGKILAETNGGWEGSAQFEMTFKSSGAIDIGQKLVKYATNPPQMMYRAQPVLVCPGGNVEGYAIPPVNNANTYYFPQQTPSAPPMYQQAGPSNPPTYYPTQQPPYNNGYQTKEMEANQSTLPPQYDPSQAPPKYDDVNKKDQ